VLIRMKGAAVASPVAGDTLRHERAPMNAALRNDEMNRSAWSEATRERDCQGRVMTKGRVEEILSAKIMDVDTHERGGLGGRVGWGPASSSGGFLRVLHFG
jgi:hypothetical protein